MAAKQTETEYSAGSLIDKLGVKPDASVATLGINDKKYTSLVSVKRFQQSYTLPGRLSSHPDEPV